MDFKSMYSSKWHVWLNHGEGQIDVYAPDLETAKKEARAQCLKRKVLVDRHLFDDIIQHIEKVA